MKKSSFCSNKFRKIFLAAGITLCSLSLVGCGDKQVEKSLFYKPNDIANKVFVIKGEKMSDAEEVMIESLQGILAKEKATIFIEDLDAPNESGNMKTWLDQASTKDGFTYEYVNNAWTLLSKFKRKIKDFKYVLYTSPETSGNIFDLSINTATTIAGVENYVMVDESIELLARSRGLTLGVDARKMTTREVFEKYKDDLNPSFLVHQNPSRIQLRDYAIAGKALCYYSDYEEGDLFQEILSWADENAPIFGWTENELDYVTTNSLCSKITIPSDWSSNLSFFSSLNNEGNALKQNKYKQQEVVGEKGKHYVAIVMSDGDNIQWVERNFFSNVSFFGSKYRGNFKMTWGISPSLYDLAPNIMEKCYDTATDKDQFIAGPGGLGYVNVTSYNEESLGDYAALTNRYMANADLEYVNLLDSFVDKDALETLGKQDHIKGGIWSVGDKYIEEGGSVYWANNKPFITAREALWRTSGSKDNDYYGYVERVAQRINGYKRDYTTIEGYTVVIAHAWSLGTMDSIARFVNNLDDDVELVTVGEMVDMVTRYVDHEDVEVLDDIDLHYFDKNLAPISTNRIIWKDVKDMPVTSRTSFSFNNSADLGGFVLDHGTKDFDNCYWTSESGGAIYMDGSDFADLLDDLPNSWLYNMFEFSDEAQYLDVNVDSGANADVNFRVSALYEEDGEEKFVPLVDRTYGKDEPNKAGYYLLSISEEYKFDITFLRGKKALLIFEQDDSGEGSGEIVYLRDITILNEESEEA